MVFVFFMIMSGLMAFFINGSYLLIMLMLLEFIFLSLYLGLFINLSLYEMEQYFSLIYLIFIVCESVLGLSLMLLVVRSFGVDNFGVLSILW
uniref:NADH-ubiquinone oxidoreductase chain 4L n=1 Tax=Elateroidea sp. 2 KM-2017 TaxID=2219425 RepID=A0A346RG87_9COLE|nr:NADH dehydrogenase subunit 4L [Elateroidea sp. 2 KM-2017]